MADRRSIINDTSSILSNAGMLVTRCETLHKLALVAKKEGKMVINLANGEEADAEFEGEVEVTDDPCEDLRVSLQTLPIELLAMMGAIASLEKQVKELFKAERRLASLVSEEHDRLDGIDKDSVDKYAQLLADRKRPRVNEN